MGLLGIADTLGVIAFSISGFLIASKHHLDLLGVVIIAFLTALGGGMIRDVLVSSPPLGFTDYTPTLTVFITLICAYALNLHKQKQLENRFYFIISDTLGLASFAMSGALVGIGAGFNLIGVMFLALITAVGGGVLRDMLLNEIPFILKSEVYGSIALLMGGSIYLLDAQGIATPLPLGVVFVCGVCIRLLAFYGSWHLPKLS